ncbi:recombinase family protein [Flavimaricola sp.]|nr:recombinase family protein [Flavimaricola sp.]MDA9020248.1 recombinase family protein [Flavimaricola sp.]
MAEGRFISYLRVSTEKQGKSGLGLEAQRHSVAEYLNGGNWELVAEVVEVESGKNDKRPKLAEAINLCKAYNAVLVVAKMDRLARDAHFLLGLQKSGVEFVAADNPQANRLTVGILALVAEQEREASSKRTKDALAAAKARGQVLGAYDRDDKTKFVGRTGTAEDVAKAREARSQKATGKAQNLKLLFDRLNPDGSLSLAAMARLLNDEGIPTPSGKGSWQAVTVSRVLSRM